MKTPVAKAVNDLHIQRLLRLKELVLRLQSTPSANKKIEVLTAALRDVDGHMIAEYFMIANDPFRKHHLISDKVGEPDGANMHDGVRLLQALDMFAARKITGMEQRCMWKAVLNGLPRGLHATANSLLDRDLGVRMAAVQVNKAFVAVGMKPIPQFDVALGTPYESDEKGKFPNLFTPGANWVWSRKYDGLRAVIFIGKSVECCAVTRKGNPYTTLEKLLVRARQWKGAPFALDMEVALTNKSGADDFKGIMKEWSRKDHTIANPRAYVFDCIPLQEFKDRAGVTAFSQRQAFIKEVLAFIDPEGERFVRVKQIRVRSLAEMEALRETAVVLGEEGGIMRRLRPYNGRRSKDIFKVKTFFDIELRVRKIEYGEMLIKVDSITRPGTKVDRKINTVASVKVAYKGNLVGVGSGFTMEERRAIEDDEDIILGKLISIRHFGETTDEKTGKPSLRFPTYQATIGVTREA